MYSIGGKKYATLAEYGVASLVPSGRVAKITPADADLPGGACRGLWVGVPGTANLVLAEDKANEAVEFPLQIGFNPFAVIRVKAGGTAEDIWAVY